MLIAPVTWEGARGGELPSPFQRGKQERPLRITLHTSTFAALAPPEWDAADALRELAGEPDIVTVATEPGPLPQLHVGPFDPTADHVPVSVRYPDGRTSHTGVWFPAQWPRLAAQLAGQSDPHHPDAQAALGDLLVAQAHAAARQDILVTGSPWLLGPTGRELMGRVNPLRPSDAAKLSGLFLRSRERYLLLPGLPTGRWLLYWALARAALPSMRRYFGACVPAGDARGDDTASLGGSVLLRFARALQARDAIGVQCYVPQTHDAQDAAMYHFDYLSLLLVGALDAQARVAHRAYGLPARAERNASFNKPAWRDQLLRQGAVPLHRLATDPASLAVLSLLFTLRHLIHGAALHAVTSGSDARSASTLVELPNDEAQQLWDAAEGQGSAARWGMTQSATETMFSPYPYASALVEECLRLIDAIAAETDVARLFPLGHVVPPLTDAPSEDVAFSEPARRWLSFLG